MGRSAAERPKKLSALFTFFISHISPGGGVQVVAHPQAERHNKDRSSAADEANFFNAPQT
jgi:hypothetical protein